VNELVETICRDEVIIIGKWKLVEAKVYTRHGLVLCDCSQYDIVYEFKRNGTLMITGDVDSVDTYIGQRPAGIYPYSFVELEERLTFGGYYSSYGLTIGTNTTYWYRFYSEGLEITMAPVDGETYNFVRITKE